VTFNRVVYFLAFLALIASSCSTKKNSVVSRAYHNVTARYNGYYYSNENLAEGVYKIEKSNKDNFEKILPVYIYPTSEKVKATFPEFDKAIKKSSLLIQKHAIKDKKGNEIPTAGKWIDNNWINIGIAHFYKREFFSAIEAFEYVVRTYNKSDDKFTAMMWLVKANNEIGAVSSSEQILSLLKNERRSLPRNIKNELPVIWADYYIRRGMYTEAVAKLMEATRNSSFIYGIPKKKRARYSFIIGQLSEQLKDNKRAREYYQRTTRLKPNYEMVFYSKIKQARLIDVKRSNTEKTKRELLKMTKEFKNSEYYDVIYYTLGEIEEKEKNIPQALHYYKRSVQTSVSNPNQKALSYLKLGEINFDLTNYQPAEAYYDSTIATLPGDHPEYASILARKKTLESLVTHIKTITREDSLQRIARMSESERDAFITKLMEKIQKEEERKQQELEAAQNAAQTNTLQGNNVDAGFGGMPGSGTSWYFYNQTTVTFGISDFMKKWGNRKLEDNWRRSNKAVILEDEEEIKDTAATKTKGGGKKVTAAKTKEYYLKNVPINDTMMKKSDTKIIRAYYMMGTIYKEDLHNNKKAVAAFEELNKRYPNNQYALNTYYGLYRIYLAEKNNERAEYYKNKILTEFPDSEFALLIKNPDYAQELNTKKSEVENFYATVYDAYMQENYNESYTKAKEGISKFGKNDYRPKFEFIKSMSAGKIKGVDTLEQNLKLLVAKYPDSEVTPRANEVLAAINKQKNPAPLKEEEKAKKDTFVVNFESVHFIIAITPDDPKVADGFKKNVGIFNTVFYNDKKFEISSNLFGSNKQLIVVKSFSNAKDAMSYYDNLQSDQDVYKDEVKKELIEVFPISADNLPFLYKTKNVEGYKSFYGDTYKRLNRN
jgi:tetratricopeptide (TPR) repeat protein